jgi:peptidoglycan/LPS O-acetylase OafA/YrhL
VGLGASALASVAFLGLCAAQVVPLELSLSLPAYWYMFAVGMGLAVASVALGDRAPRSRPLAFLTARPEVGWLAAAGLLVVAATIFSYDWVGHTLRGPTQMIGNGVSCVGLAFLLVFPAVFGQDRGGLVRRILSSRVLTWVGVVSYGVYLWHDPLILWLADTNGTKGRAAAPIMWIMPSSFLQHPAAASLVLGSVGLLLTLAAASVSYYLVELPFLRYKERGSFSPRRLLPGTRRRDHQHVPKPVGHGGPAS